MAEYIEREAIIEAFVNGEADVIDDYGDGCDFGFSLDNIREILNAIPTAEVEPVRHTTFKDGECMACGWFGDCVDTPHYNYCPGCGARADGGADNG